MDCTVHGISGSLTQLSDLHFHFSYCCKVLCLLHYLIAMELMQDSVYCSPQGIVGMVLTLLKAVHVPGTCHILFNH